MPRIARIVNEGYPHHIIQRGNNRQKVFFDNQDRKTYLQLLKKYSSECGCKIHAYCLMDNHIHFLSVPKEKKSLARTMQKLSLRYTQYFNKKRGRTGRLWECRFYSSIVDKDNYLLSVCRYIERNPVRAGLVKDAIQYRWSSILVNTTVGRVSFIDPIWKKYIGLKQYRRYLLEPENEDEIKFIIDNTKKGWPIGKEDFRNCLGKEMGINLVFRSKGRPKDKL